MSSKFKRNTNVAPARNPVTAAPQQDTKPVSPTADDAVEAAMVHTSNQAIAGAAGNILSDEDVPEKVQREQDKPNTKYQDMDFSNSDLLADGRRVIQLDALARALNEFDGYLLDVPKPWGSNPLGGRPIDIRFTREFPSKRILYDSVDLSPEVDEKKKAEEIVQFKMKLANDHGYRYLYQHPWTVLTPDELDRQLAIQNKLMKVK